MPVITTLTGSERSYRRHSRAETVPVSRMNGSPIGFIANAPMPSRTSRGSTCFSKLS